MEVKEKAIGLEQEAEQWKTTCEQLQEDSQRREVKLHGQLKAKDDLMEQLTDKGNEHQLEINELCAESVLLKERLHDEPRLSHT